MAEVGLQNIGDLVQNVAEAISAVLEMEITVADHRGIRIAGTGNYKNMVGEKVPDGSIFLAAIREGKSFLVENPGKDSVCKECRAKHSCFEWAEACTPITTEPRNLGVIGVIALNSKQRKRFLERKERYFNFISKMAGLIAVEVNNEIITNKLALVQERWDVALNSLKEGIIITDKFGIVTQVNNEALNLLKHQPKSIIGKSISTLLPHASISFIDLEKNRLAINDEDLFFRREKNSFHLVFSVSSVLTNKTPMGLVITLRNFQDITRSMFKATQRSETITFDMILGESSIMRSTKLLAQKAAQSDAKVLIIGESGTGKELFARAIHVASWRREGPFVPINCSAIPETLFESELFGYEEGAFTGAQRGGKLGKIELSHGGTLFLDEIGDMPQYMQAKILRVLQDNQVFKIGGTKPVLVDVRVIAATNQKLKDKVTTGKFREDLFYRLNVIPISVPPLRERIEDLELLCKAFLKKYNKVHSKKIISLEKGLVTFLKTYHWPGNIRELENIIEYGVCLETGSILRKETVLPRLDTEKPERQEYPISELPKQTKKIERKIIMDAIKSFRHHKNPIENAARALGISRATIYRKIKIAEN